MSGSRIRSFLAVALAASAPTNSVSFTIAGHPTAFMVFPESHLTITSGCGQDPKKLQCEAYVAIRELMKQSLRPDVAPSGSANLGAVLCDEATRGQSIVGRDTRGNENSFCQFADGSAVDTGSIEYYYLQGRKQVRNK